MNEATYWRQRYEMLMATFSEAVKSAIDASITPRLLADKEAYELGRLHGATEERDACAKICEERSVMGWTGELKVDMATINKAKDCAAAIRERSDK
jgi:hypothetical protein